MPSRNPEEEVKRLEDVIRRAAWLEWAADKKLETPYVPWSVYDDLLKENATLRERLREIHALAR